MTDDFGPNALFAPGDMDDLLTFDDESSADEPYPGWMREAAAAAGDLVGVRRIGIDIARGSVLGFDIELAGLVRRDPRYLAQLRRHWDANGLSSVVESLAGELTERGRLHAELIALAGPTENARDDAAVTPLPLRLAAGDQENDVETDVPDNVIAAWWTLSPHIGESHAAASEDSVRPSFTEANPDWGMTYSQTPIAGGEVILEIRMAPDKATPLDVIVVTIGSERRYLTLRRDGDSLLATITVLDNVVWAKDGIKVTQAISAGSIPNSDFGAVTNSVRRALMPEQNLWEDIADALGVKHRVTAAIEAGLE